MAAPVPSPRSPADRRYRIFVGVGLLVAAAAMAAAVIRTQTEEDTPPAQCRPPRRRRAPHPAPGHGGAAPVRARHRPGPGLRGDAGRQRHRDPRRRAPRGVEQNQVFFTPGEGKVIEELPAGQTCVVAIAWRSSDGPRRGRPAHTVVLRRHLAEVRRGRRLREQAARGRPRRGRARPSPWPCRAWCRPPRRRSARWSSPTRCR